MTDWTGQDMVRAPIDERIVAHTLPKLRDPHVPAHGRDCARARTAQSSARWAAIVRNDCVFDDIQHAVFLLVEVE